MIKKLILFSFFTLLCASGFSQRMQPETSQWVDDVQIDGQLTEWGDSLAYYFEDQDLQYAFANDDEFLYVAIRVKDVQKQIQACFNGFSVMVNKSGKKKDGPTLLFPIPDRAALRGMENKESDQKDLRLRTLDAIRAIYVRGFTSILDGPISLENNYGVNAAVRIDSADHLCYEGAIKLDQLHLNNNKTFAINIKINGMIKSRYTSTGPMGGRQRYPYGSYGYGYDNYPRSTIVNKEEPGIWNILSLATKP